MAMYSLSDICELMYTESAPEMCNVTHMLLVIEKQVMKLPFTKYMQCHSQAVGHKKRCDETAFHTNLQCIHHLLVIGLVMRLLFTKLCIECQAHLLLVI